MSSPITNRIVTMNNGNDNFAKKPVKRKRDQSSDDRNEELITHQTTDEGGDDARGQDQSSDSTQLLLRSLLERTAPNPSQLQLNNLSQDEFVRRMLLQQVPLLAIAPRPESTQSTDTLSWLIQRLISSIQPPASTENHPSIVLPARGLAGLPLASSTSTTNLTSQLFSSLLWAILQQTAFAPSSAPSPVVSSGAAAAPSANAVIASADTNPVALTNDEVARNVVQSILASVLVTRSASAVPVTASHDVLSSFAHQVTASRVNRTNSFSDGEALNAAVDALITTNASDQGVAVASSNVARGRVIPLSLPTDMTYVSEYQVLLREQIDLFEATEADLMARAQGRNKPIQINSVGIRCRHCSSLHPGFRPRGAVYFPTKLIGLYHSSQNMAANHFSGSCKNTPGHITKKLATLRQNKAVVYGRCSQRYWEQAAEKIGVMESDGRLVFSGQVSSMQSTETQSTTDESL